MQHWAVGGDSTGGGGEVGGGGTGEETETDIDGDSDLIMKPVHGSRAAADIEESDHLFALSFDWVTAAVAPQAEHLQYT